METTERTTISPTGILAMLLILGVVGGLYWNQTRSVANRFDREEQRGDSLLSVKLQLEGDVRSLTSQLKTATGANESLARRINDLHDQLNQQEVLTHQLRRQTSSRTHLIQGLHQTMSTMATTRDSIENQLAAVIDKVGWLTDSNGSLLEQNKAIQQQLKETNTTLLTQVSRSAVTADAFMVASTKSNQKATAKARKVNTLTISLNLPADLQVDGVQDVFLSLTDSQNNSIMPPLKTATVTLDTINEIIPVHAIQRVDFSKNPKRISLRITPDHTLKPGKYVSSVYTKDTYIGSVEFQLRDSFWFF